MSEVSVPLLVDGKISTEQLGGVGADATKFLRGDQSWAVPSGAVSWEEEWNKHIQSGQLELIQSRYATVYFVKSFVLVPKILLTMRDPTARIVVVTEVNQLYFKIDMGNVTSVVIDWIAIAR